MQRVWPSIQQSILWLLYVQSVILRKGELKRRVQSFTTVGYGDISPVTFWGRLAIVLLIIFIFIAVPFHTDLIADIIKSYDSKNSSSK